MSKKNQKVGLAFTNRHVLLSESEWDRVFLVTNQSSISLEEMENNIYGVDYGKS